MKCSIDWNSYSQSNSPLSKPKKFSYHIIQAIALVTHALSYAFLLKHSLILPSLFGMEDQPGAIWDNFKSLVEYIYYYAQDRLIRDGIILVWFLFWYNKSLYLLFNLSYCLTNRVQFKIQENTLDPLFYPPFSE